MFKKVSLFFIFLSLLVVIIPAQAQTETEIISRAERLIRNIVPNVGNVSQWQYTGYVMTNDGALGCPLVTSYNLGYSVIPWRVSLTFSNGQTYIVYVSSDPNVSVLCDSKLLGGVTNTTTTTYAPSCTATTIAGRRGAIYTAPNSGVLSGYLDLFGSIAVLGRSTDTAWYQVGNTSVTGWVSIYDILLNGAGCTSLAVTSTVTTPNNTIPTNYVGQGVGGPVSCFLSATFANIRTLPSLNGAIIEQVTSGQVYGVTGRTLGSDWYEVFTRSRAGTGWVSVTVSSAQGTGCASLPVTGTSDPNANPSPSNPIITNCLPTYAGYLLPRLQVGARARVTSIIPILRLRSTPQALVDNSNLVLEIRSLDIVDVISGPICEAGVARVWWQVLYNGVYGWTAESDLQATNAYYLEPLVNAPGRRFADDVTTSEVGRLQTGSAVLDITFSPDGTQLLAVNGADTFVRTFDSITGNNLDTAYLNNTGAPLTHVLAGENVVTVDINAMVSVWSLVGESIANYPVPFAPISNTQVSLKPDGTKLAIAACTEASLEGCIVSQLGVMTLATGDVQVVEFPQDNVTSVAYHPTEDKILVGTKTGSVVIWDAVAGNIPIALEAAQVYEVAYSPDASKIAVAYCEAFTEESVCGSVQIALFDAQTLTEIATLSGHTNTITSMTFSPNSTQLASGGLDDMVILWDIATVKELNRYMGYTFGVSSLNFNPAGNLLVTGDNVGNVILLNLE
ncbi:MAG: SH3 domain-containing protein [bacterium]|nr:SH3 domain-containing protein [bacterium]